MTTTSNIRTTRFDEPLATLDDRHLAKAWQDWFDHHGIPLGDVVLGYDLEVDDKKHTISYRGAVTPLVERDPQRTRTSHRGNSALPKVTVQLDEARPPVPGEQVADDEHDDQADAEQHADA